MAEILGDVRLSISAIKDDSGPPFVFCQYENRYSFGVAARTGRVRNGLPEFALITAPQGCREGFTGAFKSILARKEEIGFVRRGTSRRSVDKYMNSILGKNKKVAILVVPPRNVRKGVSSRNRVKFHENALVNSLEVLNNIEAEYGWPRSICYRVEGVTFTVPEPGNRSLDMKSYVVEVSKRWFRAPHLISMISLILRSGEKFAKISGDQLKTIELRSAEEALSVLEKAYKRGNKRDIDRLVAISKCLPDIMKQYQKVFGSITTDKIFFPKIKDPKGSKYPRDLGGLEGMDYLLRMGHGKGVASKTLAEKLSRYKVLKALKTK